MFILYIICMCIRQTASCQHNYMYIFEENIFTAIFCHLTNLHLDKMVQVHFREWTVLYFD